MKDAAYWIGRLALVRHPEGGWFRESYRSAEGTDAAGLPERFGGRRSFATAIYFLLERGDVSALHRIRSDEMWHFYAGSPLMVEMIDPAGAASSFVLGSDPDKGETFQGVVPADCWFGATVEGEWSLVGCTVSPGFDFTDFEMGERSDLMSRFPQHRPLIERLTRR